MKKYYYILLFGILLAGSFWGVKNYRAKLSISLPKKDFIKSEIKSPETIQELPLLSPQKRKPTSLLVKQESKAIEQWTKDFIEASGENRNKILKQRLSDMKKNSLTVLPEMIERLQELPAHHQTERVSLFLALGEVGPTVSQEARTLIQGIVNQELTKPDQAKISLDPQTIDFHHNTQFQKKEDGVYLSNVSTKLAALDTLRTIGDKESIQKLIEIAKDPSQPQYLRNAADDAILSFLDPAEAAKIRAALN